MKNYYSILGIFNNASQDDIKRAYRQKAKLYHPDVSDLDNAQELFVQVHEAYSILSNPQRRSHYDLILDNYLNKQKPIKSEIFKDWEVRAKEEGVRYSNLSFTEFKYKVLDALVIVVEGTKKATIFGCGMFYSISFIVISLILLSDLISIIIECRCIDFRHLLFFLIIAFFGLIGVGMLFGINDRMKE